eukprot:11223671-Lingulodinium_polyedra.AAC.1
MKLLSPSAATNCSVNGRHRRRRTRNRPAQLHIATGGQPRAQRESGQRGRNRTGALSARARARGGHDRGAKN